MKMYLVQKKGQVAIWVILALVLIALVVIIVLFSRRGTLPGSGSAVLEPQSYLSSCLEPFVQSAVESLSKQGGYREPQGFIVYQDVRVPYLCYTSEYYKPCIVQQPNIIRQFSREMEQELLSDAQTCVNSFKEAYEKNGYSVNVGRIALNISLAPQLLNVQLIAPMTVTKDISRSYTSFELSFKSSMYELLSLVDSIIGFEAVYGDSETTLYLRYYPDIRIEKTRLSDGSKIYTVSDVISHEHFTFASRGLAWPPGYGT